MTGGDPGAQGKGVKDFTLRGAIAAARPGRPAGVVGIIPDGSRSVRLASQGSVHVLSVQTGVSNWERDVLTGTLPDVLIALQGERGTLAEVAYALNAGRPILFLDSWKQLKDEFAARPGRVGEVIEKLGEPRLQSKNLVAALKALFAERKRRKGVRRMKGVAAAAALEAARALSRAVPVSPPRFPRLQRNPVRNLENELTENLTRLMSAMQGSSS
jgi:hypothetical protein